jgi:hypothetical protein
MKENKKYSFEQAWQKRVSDTSSIKKRIMTACNIKNEVSWRQRRRGEVGSKADEKEAIEKIFSEYGITEVWDSLELEKLS